MFITSLAKEAVLGKGGHIFGSIGLSVCPDLFVSLFVSNITQNVMNRLQ